MASFLALRVHDANRSAADRRFAVGVDGPAADAARLGRCFERAVDVEEHRAAGRSTGDMPIGPGPMATGAAGTHRARTQRPEASAPWRPDHPDPWHRAASVRRRHLPHGARTTGTHGTRRHVRAWSVGRRHVRPDDDLALAVLVPIGMDGQGVVARVDVGRNETAVVVRHEARDVPPFETHDGVGNGFRLVLFVDEAANATFDHHGGRRALDDLRLGGRRFLRRRSRIRARATGSRAASGQPPR